MTRRYGDVVLVRSGERPPTPSTFLWRDRLYLVRDVLGHWREGLPWWEGAASRPAGAADRRRLAAEREVWRVEASAGRVMPIGVYDLCREGDDWQLIRVSD